MNCKKCGTLIKNDSNICDVCGEKVDLNQPNFQYELESSYKVELEKDNEKASMWIALSIILLVAAGIAFAVFNRCDECPTCETNNESNMATTSSKIKLSGYNVILSDNYKYTVEGNTMYISDKTDNWGASLYIIDGTMATLATKLEKMKETMILDGYTLNKVEEKIINNNKFLVIEGIKMNTHVLFALTGAGKEEVGVCVLEIYNIDEIFDYDVLNDLAPTLNNVKFDNPPLSVTIKDYDLTRFSLFTK